MPPPPADHEAPEPENIVELTENVPIGQPVNQCILLFQQ
jgi:hypothetical protein